MQTDDWGDAGADEDWDEIRGYFGPESMAWRLTSEAAMLLGGGRAVLMQLAHPLVAAGVAQFSSYSHDPWGRTNRTIELTSAITFGTRSEARAAAREINRLHMRVTGRLDEAAGRFPIGAPYQARNPDLLLWVLATLVDTVLTLYPLLVAPLSLAEQERYYQESKVFGALLGLPPTQMPETLADFHTYMQRMLTGADLATTSEAHAVARLVMHMPIPFVLRPVFAAAEQATIGLLPPPLRELYGFSWDARRQALLDVALASSRTLLPHVPPVLREVPWARAAFRRVRILAVPA